MDRNCNTEINITNNFELKKFYHINGKVEGQNKTECYEYHQLRPDRIYRIFNFVSGKIHGKYYEFHTNGKIYTMCNYNNGNIEGPFRQYYASGKRYTSCNFVNNKIHGEYIEYYENGNIKMRHQYVNGVDIDNEPIIYTTKSVLKFY
jgi:antitoxin component YwqK of YwqJK toxin-antitoxin module